MVGLVPRVVANLFVAIGTDVRNVYTVRASFVQIYNEQIDDLLKPRNTNLKLRFGFGFGLGLGLALGLGLGFGFGFGFGLGLRLRIRLT